MHHLMREVLVLTQATVRRYEGTFLQVSGAGFLALFGVPMAQEDHARRAVLAALDLRQRLHALEALRGPPSIVLQSMPQAVQFPAPMHHAIVAKAVSNPFFVEELTWAVVEQDAHAGTVPLPDTIEAVLAARIDRLLPEAKHLVQIAAVIGSEVPVPLLQAIAELPEATLHRGLAHLQAVEFLYETRLFPEPEDTFKHALTHEVAYGILLLERRRALHAHIVEALEALAPDRVAEVASGRSPEQVERLAHLPEHGDTRGLAIELRLALGGPLHQLGEYGRRLTLLGEAETPARALDDRTRLGRVLAGIAYVRMVTGDNDGAMVAGRQALELAAELGESALQRQASYFLGQTYYARRHAGTRRSRCASLVSSMPTLSPPMSRRPKPTTSRP